MARCASWRPCRCPVHKGSPRPPGVCRHCWIPCRNRVPRGQRRCGQCERVIAMMPQAEFKLDLVREGASRQILAYLADDPNVMVARAAREALGEGES